jgi:hypothetical protein
MLKTEQNTPEMGERIHQAFTVSDHWLRRSPELLECRPFFEHGHWWIEAMDHDGEDVKFTVVDAVGGDAIDGFSFEEL